VQSPANVLPFAWTGGDGNHFGFLWDVSLVPADQRPIVKVYGCDDDDAIEVVASNLADFLSLVAVAFAEVVSREATDAEWFRFRDEWYGDDPAMLTKMHDKPGWLFTLPGVRRLDSPRAVANAAPNQRFWRRPSSPSSKNGVGVCGSRGSLASGQHEEGCHRIGLEGQHVAVPRAEERSDRGGRTVAQTDPDDLGRITHP
jgi:hypothetical protein